MADDRGNTIDNSTDQNAQPTTPLTGGASPSAAPLGAAPEPAPDYSESSAQGQSGFFQGNPNAVPATGNGDQKPSMWRNIVMGALVGMAGGSGAKTFSQGFGGGARMSLEQAQLQKENAIRDQQLQMQKESHESTIKFQSAQAASLAVDTAIRDAHLHNLPQEMQDANNLRSLQQLEEMKNLGLSPTIVTANTKGGTEVKAGLQQLTESHGGVPPMFTIVMGDKIIGFDLNQLTKAPQALDQINKIRQMQGQTAIDPQTWASLPAEAKNAQTVNAFGFWAPAASEGNLIQYQNTLATVKAQPDSPEKAANVAKLQTLVDSMKGTLDALQKRTTQQYKDETPAIAGRAGATEYAKKAAENKADNENDAANNKNANLTGQPYYDTLATSDQNTIRAIMEGRMELSTRMLQTKEGQKIAKQLNQVDPSFDMSRAPNYFKTRQDFSHGPSSQGINHLNVAIQHLGKLYDAATFTSTGVTGWASRNLVQPISSTTTNATAFKVELQRVQDELAHVYDNKSLTDSDKKEIRSGAAGINNWTANANRADMYALVGLLQSKLHAYKSTWDNAKPSAAIPDFPVISPESAVVINKLHAADPRMVDEEKIITPQESRNTLPTDKNNKNNPEPMVTVQIPGMAAGQIPQSRVKDFQAKHPNAVIGQ